MLELRWQYIKNLEVEFSYIKSIIKKYFNYNVIESNLDQLLENNNLENNYPDIDQFKLLSYIEEYSYKRMSILVMRTLANGKTHPVYEELDNEAFKSIFKTKNGINNFDNDEYIGDLDSIYKVVNYKEIGDHIIIKLACKETRIELNIDDDGMESEEELSYYDCIKFIINIKQNKIFMFYNNTNKNANNVDFTKKKNAFYQLFTKANRANIYHYTSNTILNAYFNEYYDENINKNIRKSISEIITESPMGDKNSVFSRTHNFRHSQERLKAIKSALDNEDHDISSIEILLNEKIIKIKGLGEIISNSILNKEVLKSVCEEFYPDFKIYEL